MGLTIKPTREASQQKQAALEEVRREETTRFNTRLPVSLHKALKLRAIEEGKAVTMVDITVRALLAYLYPDGEVDKDSSINRDTGTR